MLSIDLNADVGEGFGAYVLGPDAELLTLVSSASIACGFHAGDPVTMRKTVTAAAHHGVAIGAHPGYPDLLGFGRREMSATPDEITAYVLYQVGALDAVCRSCGTRLRYVKPHGALYNRAVGDPVTAAAIAKGVRLVGPGLTLLGLAGSHLIDAGKAVGLPTAAEAFADRAYTGDGSLVPRSEPRAVIHDVGAVVARSVQLVADQRVVAVDGTLLDVRADSLCVHGDTPGALDLLRALRAGFAERGIGVAPFTS